MASAEIRFTTDATVAETARIIGKHMTALADDLDKLAVTKRIITGSTQGPLLDPDCRSESGMHFAVKESDGVWVCQICGEVKPTVSPRRPASAAGRDAGGEQDV